MKTFVFNFVLGTETSNFEIRINERALNPGQYHVWKMRENAYKFVLFVIGWNNHELYTHVKQ